MNCWKEGTRRLVPKNSNMMPAIIRRIFAGIPVARTIVVKKRVNKVKLKIKPRIIPKGRFFPPLRDPDKTIGRTGRMQGDRIVTIPARKAKKKRISIS